MSAAPGDPTYIVPASIEADGVSYSLDVLDIARILRGNPHRMPGTHRSLTLLRARYKYPDAPWPPLVTLVASALAVDELTVRSGAGDLARPPLRPVRIERNGTVFEVHDDELEGIDSQLAHGSWFVAHLYPQMKRRCNDVSIAVAMVAGLTGKSDDEIRQTLDWHNEYMRWHDGDSSYDIY